MHAASPAKQASRVWYFDLLRIAASFGVIVLHANPLLPEDVDVFSAEWRIVLTYQSLFFWCVPVFLMISGALFLSPKRKFSVRQLYQKSILRILTSFLAWSAFYALCHCIINGKGKWAFLNQLLRGHYHMWFLFYILGLYILTPLLRKMTESKEATRYFVILGFLFSFLIPRLLSFILLFDFPHRDVVQSLQSAFAQTNPVSGIYILYYYVLGYYLHAYPPRRKGLVYLAGIAGFVLTFGLTVWHSQKTGAVSGMFYSNASTTVLLMAAAVFLFFRSAFGEFHAEGHAARILLRLSACSFGVYLVHPFVIERLQIYLPVSCAVLMLGTPLLCLIIYLISLLISMALGRIPVLKKSIV